MADAEFLSALIKGCDPYIREHGGPKGYQHFREDDARSMAKNQTLEEMARVHIESIAAEDHDAPFCARMLLSMYVYGERYGRTPKILKDWMLERFLKIGEGESEDKADEALHLKPFPGVRRNKPIHNQLQCVCFIKLKMRKGMNKSAAVQACRERYGTTERHVYSLLKGIEIADDIADQTLEFFRDYDVSDDYLPY